MGRRKGASAPVRQGSSSVFQDVQIQSSGQSKAIPEEVMEEQDEQIEQRLCKPPETKLADWSRVVASSSGLKSWVDEVEEHEETSKVQSSVWDKFDVKKMKNAGFKLDYVEPKMMGNQVIGEIDLSDIDSELEFWSNSVVCYVIGAHPPFGVMRGFLQRIWGKFKISRIGMLKNGIIIVRFESEEPLEEVVQGGIFHFDKKPVIVKKRHPDMEFSKHEVLSVPVWVLFPGLEFNYWSMMGLSKISSLVGKPLVVDKHTENKVGLSFARVLVEVKVKMSDSNFSRSYVQLLGELSSVRCYRLIWSPIATARQRFILWLAYQSRLLTKDRLLRMRIECSTECMLCGSGSVENHQHLFCSCAWFLSLKHHMESWAAVQLVAKPVKMFLEDLKKQRGGAFIKLFIAGFFASLVYQTWRARNACIFKQFFADITVHAYQMKREIKARMQLKERSKEAKRCRELFDRICS